MSRKETTCDTTLRGIAPGEPGVDAHLIHCASCRSEAEALEPIIRALQAEPLVEVPPGLDRSIHRALAGGKQPALNRLPARIALAFSVTSTLALTAGIAIALASARDARPAIFQGLVIGIIYLAVSSAATLPLITRASQSHREAGSWT